MQRNTEKMHARACLPGLNFPIISFVFVLSFSCRVVIRFEMLKDPLHLKRKNNNNTNRKDNNKQKNYWEMIEKKQMRKDVVAGQVL